MVTGLLWWVCLTFLFQLHVHISHTEINLASST